MNLLLISGSLRAGSVNEATLKTVQALAAEGQQDLQATIYQGMADLPHFNPDDDHDPLHPAVAGLRQVLAEADALLFCTPEYAGALPGSFKNLLDWSVGGMEMNEKPVAWINVSTNPTGAQDAHASLRTVLGYVNAKIMESACADIPVPRQAVGDGGLIDRDEIREQLRSVLDRLRRTGTAH